MLSADSCPEVLTAANETSAGTRTGEWLASIQGNTPELSPLCGDAVVWNLDGLSEFDIVQLLEPTLLSHQPLDPEYGPEG